MSLCPSCLSTPICAETVPVSCVTTSAGGPLQAVIDGFIAQLLDHTTQLNTTDLVRGTLTTNNVSSLKALLQILITRSEPDTTPQKTLAQFLSEPVLLSPGCSLPACGGAQARSVTQLLLTLLSDVDTLKREVASLKVGLPASTSIYVPHY